MEQNIYKFRCPHCKGKISVDEDYYHELVGKAINCPHCGREMTMPRMESKREPDALPADAFKNTQKILPHPIISLSADDGDPDSAYCKHCGAEVGSRDKVCISCGGALPGRKA